MTRYGDASGNSGIVAYEIGDGSIEVVFRHGGAYLYTEESAGPDAIAHMQALARGGSGLATYINQHVREAYASKRTTR